MPSASAAQRYSQRTTQRSLVANSSSTSKTALGDERKNASQKAQTAACPSYRSLSGGGKEVSKMRSWVTVTITAATPWRLKIWLERSTAPRCGRR